MNIYQHLANVPPELADKITNAKTSGGRSLTAIHKSKLNQVEKHLMLFLGSELNYTQSFVNQYRFISLSTIAENLSVNKSTISRVLNGYNQKGKNILGLIERGYIEKQIATKQEQEKGWANHYCLTAKIFDEYMLSLIENYKSKNNMPDDSSKIPTIPCRTVQLPLSHCATTPCRTVRHKVPVFKDPSLTPSLNADQKPAAAEIENKVKKEKKSTWKPKSSLKAKTWEGKSEEDKINTLMNMTRDAHSDAVRQRSARPFPFDDIPDLLMPIIKLHGNEAVKLFLDKIKGERRGCDVRRLGEEIIRGMDDKTEEGETILRKEQGQLQNEKNNFVGKLVNHLEENMELAKNIMKENKEIVESYPPLFKKFYLEINDKRSRVRIQKEINEMGFDIFFKHRAPNILKCQYEDLFLENPPSRTFL